MDRKVLLVIFIALLCAGARGKGHFGQRRTEITMGDFLRYIQNPFANEAKTGKNLVDLAEQLNLTTLVKSLAKTNLDNTIDHEGPFTLMAPTNEAFNRVPKYCYNNPLVDVLRYHVARGSVYSTSFKNDQLIPTLLSHRNVRINIYGDVITANGREISQTRNQTATNGVLHVMGDVMCAIYIGGASTEVDRCRDLKTLAKALRKAKLYTLLNSEGPFTLFAPTNEAFASLDPAFATRLNTNTTLLTAVLQYHVVPGTLYSLGLTDRQNIPTVLPNETLLVTMKDGLKVNNAAVTLPDATVSNGVVHSIDKVLIPKSLLTN